MLPARRGALYDRNGIPLAITQEFYHIGIAPNELDDVRTAFVPLVRNLGVSAPALNREFQARKRWIYLHGPFNATTGAAAAAVCTAIHLTGEFQRFYPSRDLARPIIGALAPDQSVGGVGSRVVAGFAPDGSPGRGGAAQGSRRTPLRFARTEDPRPRPRQRRDADHRRGAAGDRRAGTGRRDRADEGRRRRCRVPRPQHRRAVRPRVAAGDRRRRAERLDLHRSVRAGLDREALHRGRAARCAIG